MIKFTDSFYFVADQSLLCCIKIILCVIYFAWVDYYHKIVNAQIVHSFQCPIAFYLIES